jgi:hypothetical protein
MPARCGRLPASRAGFVVAIIASTVADGHSTAAKIGHHDARVITRGAARPFSFIVARGTRWLAVPIMVAGASERPVLLAAAAVVHVHDLTVIVGVDSATLHAENRPVCYNA